MSSRLPAEPGPAPAPERPRAWREWPAHRCGYRANAWTLAAGRRALWLGYGLVYFAAIYFYLWQPSARRGSQRYLARIWPGRGRLRRILDPYRHMVMYGYLLLDRAVILSGGARRFSVEVEGAEHYHAARRMGRGILLMTAHFGCAEATAPALANLPGAPPVNVVMYQDPRLSTERFHVEHRTALAGVRLISTSDAMDAGLKVMAALKRGEVVALRADRTLDSRTIEASLLGASLDVPAGPFMAAVLSGAPVIQVHTVRLGYRRYRVILSPLKTYAGAAREQLLAEAARDYAAALEPLLAAFPLQWGNFHDVWKS